MRKYGEPGAFSSHAGLERALRAYEAVGGDALSLYLYTEHRAGREPLICLAIPDTRTQSGRVRIHYLGYEEAVRQVRREIHKLSWPDA
jgi:hypothetical protein